jgi:hypothetical protein
MPPPRIALAPKVNVVYPALQLDWVVVDPAQITASTGQSHTYLSRRDFLKLSSVAAAASMLLSACGAPATESPTSVGASEIPIPNPESVPGFSNPVRPWIMDMKTGLVVPATADIGKQVGNSFARWINPFKPLVELHDNQQMVIRAANNTGSGAELGYESQGLTRDLKSERATSGFSFTDSAKGEQFIRPDSNGLLTAYMDYEMSSPNPSNSDVSKLVNNSTVGNQHFLKDVDGNNFTLPGNISQVLDLMKMVNYLYGKVVNDNVFGLSEGAKFEQFYAFKDQFISNILLIPSMGESQVRATANSYLTSIGTDISNPDALTTLYKQLEPMVRNVSKVDSVSIPSARLAVAIAASLANADVALFNDGQSPERSAKLEAIQSYADTDIAPNAVVAFEQEKAIEKAVENEWQRIPVSKPRAFEIIVQNYEQNLKEGKPEENKGYDRKIIFSSFAGDALYTESNGNLIFDPLLVESYLEIDPQKLQNQQIIESSNKDNKFFRIEKKTPDFKSGQYIQTLREIDSSTVKLFSLPGGKMQWGVETAKTGTIPKGIGDQIYAWLGSDAYDKIPYQEIILDDGTKYTSKIDNFFQSGWATDITEHWLEWKSNGLKEVTSMGMLTPDQYLARLSKGSMFQPQGAYFNQTLLGRYAMMDITNDNLNSLKMNNIIAAIDDLPLYQVNGGVGQQVDILTKGDVVTCDYKIIMVNNEPMLKLFDSGGLEYAVPIDFKRLQMIDNGTRDRIIETAKEWLPIALLLIPYGKGISKGARSLLNLFAK